MVAVACQTSPPRSYVARRALLLVGVIVLLFGAAAVLHAWLSPRLPHIKLEDGGELQVLQVRYGIGGGFHAFQRAPEWKFRIWKALPKRLQNLFHPPEEGVLSGLEMGDPAVSIWCGWNRSGACPTGIDGFGSLEVLPDNGKVFRTISVMVNQKYQETLIANPPHDSRYLRLEVPDPWEGLGVQRDTIRITIENPAYRRP